jgi:lipopolysaccharide/colanic/teichoic acid biosynthesis glycosyltransferase
VTGKTQLLFADEKRLLAGPDPRAAYCQHVLPLKIELDLDYVRNKSLRGDLAILARTAALPLIRIARRAGERSTDLRLWGPAVASAVVLVVAVALASAQLT